MTSASGMNALVCERYGGPETLTLRTLTQSEVGRGDVRIEVHAAGMNFADVMAVGGIHQNTPPVPFVPGFEVAGVVVDTGTDVTNHKPGDRVFAAFGHGGYADYVICPATHAASVPEELSFAEAATVPIAFGTGYMALIYRARLRPGQWLLVQGASGNIGGGALQIGRLLGARTIATAGGAEGCRRALALGADHAIDYQLPDIAGRVRNLTDGRGVDVVFDAVTGDAFATTLDCVARGGALVVAGAAGGAIPEISLMEFVTRHIALIGVDIDDYLHRDPARTAECLTRLSGWLARGFLKPRFPEIVPLSRGAEALARLAAGQTRSKLVLVPDRFLSQTGE